MDKFTIIILVAFTIGSCLAALFTFTGDKNSDRVITILCSFLFAIFFSSLLGNYFIINNHNFNLSYFEIQKQNPYIFEKYLFFLKIGTFSFMGLAVILRLFIERLKNKLIHF